MVSSRARKRVLKQQAALCERGTKVVGRRTVRFFADREGFCPANYPRLIGIVKAFYLTHALRT